MNEPEKPDLPRWMMAGFVLTGIASFGGLAAMLVIALEKVRSGEGFATYRTTWLVEFNYVGMLILFAAAVAALIIGGYFRFREYLRWREFEKKYSTDRLEPDR